MNKERENVIKYALIKLGVKCDLIGFTYLVKAIEIVVEQPLLAYNLKKLFAAVAKEFNITKIFRVEANIQNAISQAYNANGLHGINEMYGLEIFKPDHKPTTAEIIKLVAEYYNLGLYKKEAS